MDRTEDGRRVIGRQARCTPVSLRLFARVADGSPASPPASLLTHSLSRSLAQTDKMEGLHGYDSAPEKCNGHQITSQATDQTSPNRNSIWEWSPKPLWVQ